MMISTRGRYALRVMTCLAQKPEEEYIPLKEIAEQEELSKEYLNSILKVLVEHNLLISLRGKGGGYRLSRPPQNYSVGEILRLVEGSLAPVSCVAPDEACPCGHRCSTYPMWKKLDRMINDFFDGITLADLAENTAACPEQTGQ